MLTKLKTLYVSFILLTSATHAVILYDGDIEVDSNNLDDPGTGAPFYAVARVCANGGGSTRGSAVYIRGKYMLTANHVSLHTHVTFDGTTYWARDTNFNAIRIGTTDMKLFKLVNDPGLVEVPLATTSSVGETGTLIGWGRGRDPAIGDEGFGPTNIWTWIHNDTTIAKRWGTNRIDTTNTETFLGPYTALVTDLDRNQGNNEAVAVYYDSGGGIFVDDNGTWKLAGITTLTYTATEYKSTFNSGGDGNRFVDISSYYSDIEAAIPDTTILSDWKVDHSLYYADADNAADTDFDGIGQLHEFAFGGDPNENDLSILPTHALVEDGGSTYLELTVTRPIGLQGITYTPRTATDPTNWPAGATGIANASPTPVDNLDGTETLTYRRSQVISAVDQAYIRIDVSEAP